MSSTLKSTGDRIDPSNVKTVFVQGAYNLGAVYVSRELLTTAAHPGETISYPTGAAGEDNFLICPDEGISPIGLLEIDYGLVSGISTDYTVGDDVPGILYHWNPGALCTSVQCADQAGDVADAGKLLTTSSGEAGSLKILTEVALVDPAGSGTGEAYASGVTWGDQGSLHHNRCPMRQAYYQADASAAYTVTAWILNI
jgi:hypothetical protein